MQDIEDSIDPVHSPAGPAAKPEATPEAGDVASPGDQHQGPMEAEAAAPAMSATIVEAGAAEAAVEAPASVIGPEIGGDKTPEAIEGAQIAADKTAAAPPIETLRAGLIPFIAPTRAGKNKKTYLGAFAGVTSNRRVQVGAVAACLALLVAAAGAVTIGEAAKSQGDSQNLAAAIDAITARVDAMDAAKPREEAAEIRKAVGEARGGLATSRDLTGSITQLGARLDRLEHEQQARLDKLGDRLDHEAAARSTESQARNADLVSRVEKIERADFAVRVDKLEKADFATRIDKLEKADFAARLDKLEKKAATQTVASAAPAPPIAPKDSTIVPPSPGVSNETTGSIERPHPTAPIKGWALMEMRNGAAIVASRQGMREVSPGEVLPGAGRIERFERRGHEWVVVTDQGVIVQAAANNYAPRIVFRPPGPGFGPYGGFGPGYGGDED